MFGEKHSKSFRGVAAIALPESNATLGSALEKQSLFTVCA